MFFAKYDVDGNRRIDESVKQKILDYLQGKNEEKLQSGVTHAGLLPNVRFCKKIYLALCYIFYLFINKLFIIIKFIKLY